MSKECEDENAVVINMQPGQQTAEVIIRKGEAVKQLPIKEPLTLDITGTIGTVFEFMLKRYLETDQVPYNRSHIIIDREEISILLITCENDPFLKSEIRGVLQYHTKFLQFGINTGKTWTPAELGLFLKMNRSVFPSLQANMELVSKLLNFTADINNKVDKAISENGNRTDNFTQIVNSNLPKSFSITLPIFKGLPAETIEVETFAQVDGRTIVFTLLSPGAAQTLEDIRDKQIDEQIEKIKNLAPGIPIIEI